jgi:multicomponent Na+:H+ antiporter subunit B
MLNRIAVAQRGATNVPTAINFDYRALDTLGEEFILFAAAMGMALLLREHRAREEHPPSEVKDAGRLPAASPLVGLAGRLLCGPLVLFGCYIVLHGAITPGGGFQGGVLLASAPLLMAVTGGTVLVRRAPPWLVIEGGEGLGALGYAMIGVAGIVAGGTLFHNLLPAGTPRDLLSGGTILPSNVSVALEVCGAFVLVISELANRSLVLRRPR